MEVEVITVMDTTNGPKYDPAGLGDETSREVKRQKLDHPKRDDCQYGLQCNRRAPIHFREFRHPQLEALLLQAVRTPGIRLENVEIPNTFLSIETTRQQLNILYSQNGMLEVIERELSDCGSNIGHQLVVPGPSDSSKTPLTQDAGSTMHNLGVNQHLPSSAACSSSSSNTSPNPGIELKTPDGSVSSVLQKWENSCPFNCFLTRLCNEPETPFSISFQNLFDPSLGDVKRVCHLNFVVEPQWFLEETHMASLDGKETLIIYGTELEELTEAANDLPWLTIHLCKSQFAFGHHHTKMILIQYSDDSIRFIISTANLTADDWEHRTQGLWMSPRCPHVSGTKSSDSVSNFKKDLLYYLSSYSDKYGLKSWINAIQTVDTSSIKVVFIGSVPITSLSFLDGFAFGLMKMDKVLHSFPVPDEVDPNWPLLIQCSSIGNLGQTDDWMRGELGQHLMGKAWTPNSSVRLIYPTDSNVRQSINGIEDGVCLPYFEATHLKQQWLIKYMYHWKSDLCQRSQAMPHIKTYARVSPDGSKLGYFLLTSANLSKAAWGKLSDNENRITIMSWEAGVLFLPSLLGLETSFTICKSRLEDKESSFLLPYDLPLKKYEATDTPWFQETLMKARGLLAD